MNTDCKLTSLDVSKNKKLVYLFASGNLLKEIDLSNNSYLQQLYLADNKLTSINLDNNPQLVIGISMTTTRTTCPWPRP